LPRFRHEGGNDTRRRHLGRSAISLFDSFVEGQGRSPRQHYDTMTLDGIKEYPVAAMAAADCFLFLWVPLTLTPEVEPIMAAWDFVFSGSAFVWAKRTKRDLAWHMGCGFGTRKNVEVCWLGRRGNPKRLSCGVRELLIAPVREHSRKPDELYRRIEDFCSGPFVELFARQRRAGWTSIGDEVGLFGDAS
jgi:N6-adenosine-specific RNA methylase IME4